MNGRLTWFTILVGFAVVFFITLSGVAQDKSPPYKITILEEKAQITDAILPIDPVIRLTVQQGGFMAYGLAAEGKRLTFSSGSARTSFRIDGQVIYPNNGPIQQLPPNPRGKPRFGTSHIWTQGDFRVTQTQEIVPSKLPGKAKPGQKRKMDTLLVRYLVENTGKQTHNFGLRMRADMYNWTTDGPEFAAPTTMPGKVLNAASIEGKNIPEYLMSLQNPNLQNPGNVAYFTFKFSYKSELPSKVITTQHGAPDLGWDVQVMQYNGDSDIVLIWADKPIPPGGKREIVYGYGQGLATSPENEGRVELRFEGSLQPEKIFTIHSFITDPLDNQTLDLELPEGVQLLEGKQIQPVPLPQVENVSLVSWKAKMLAPGTHAIRLHSSNGITYEKKIVVEKVSD
jgi:hypothetical protein